VLYACGMSQPTYCRASTPALVEAYIHQIEHVFSWDEPSVRRWMSQHGDENIRLVTLDNQPAGGLTLMPMGTFFGGKRVSLTGIAVVVVPAEHRGRGIGTTLTRDAVREIHVSGAALAGLYPATLPVYRNAGFEHAGVRYGVTLPIAGLKLRDEGKLKHELQSMTLEPFEPSRQRELESFYTALAPDYPGFLDRSPPIWAAKTHHFRGEPTRGFLVRHNGTLEGYFFFLQKREGANPFDIIITDVLFRTPRAGRRIAAYIADHWSIAREARFLGSPMHPLFNLFTERSEKATLQDKWMLRIVNVKAAIEQRGYPAGLSTRFALDITDPLLESNTGLWEVHIEHGHAKTHKTSTTILPILQLSISALAPIYSGYQSPASLLAAGLINADADPAALTAVRDTFNGEMPWMQEIY
jgi:predicted acetyltransferase